MNKVNSAENKYQRGKIYKLASFQTDKVYVGSTCEPYLSNRFSKHKVNCKRYQNGKDHYITSYELLKFDDCEIVLLETYPCDNKHELHARERYWIEQLDCVNKIRPTRSRQEYLKVYNEINKETLAQKKKVYQDVNKDKITAYKQIYQQGEKYKEYQKQYYESKKETLKAKNKKRMQSKEQVQESE